MTRKASLDKQKRRGSAASSTRSSTSTASSVDPPPPKVKIFTPDGTDYRCKITIDSIRWDLATVTLQEAGRRLETRRLSVGERNQRQMHLWHYSMVSYDKQHPKAQRKYEYMRDMDKLDPGQLLDVYKDRLDYLEVVTEPNVASGKWLIQPLSFEQRQAPEKARQEAEAKAREIQRAIENAKEKARQEAEAQALEKRRANEKAAQEAKVKAELASREAALSLRQLAEEERRLEKARSVHAARKKAKAEEAARRQAASTCRRRKSSDSLGSTYKTKEARVSVSSVSSTQTSSILARDTIHSGQGSPNQKEHSSHRKKWFGKRS